MRAKFAFIAIVIMALCLSAPARTATAIKTIYVIPTSHWDRGFVVPPEQIPEMVSQHIDELIDAADKDPDFRWTIESTWQVLAWLERSRGLGDIIPGKPARINALMKLIQSGRVDLSAVWGSMHSEFMGAEELNRLVYDFASLHRTYSINSQLAVMDDVPGQPFSLPSVLAGSGLRYLLVGANQFIGGGTSLSPGNVPFYWEGPDGKRVLTWVSQSPKGGYTEGITDFFIDPFTTDPYTQTSPKRPEKNALETMQTGVDALLKRLANAGYRYDAALVMHAHDFLHPSTVSNLSVPSGFGMKPTALRSCALPPLRSFSVTWKKSTELAFLPCAANFRDYGRRPRQARHKSALWHAKLTTKFPPPKHSGAPWPWTGKFLSRPATCTVCISYCSSTTNTVERETSAGLG